MSGDSAAALLRPLRRTTWLARWASYQSSFSSSLSELNTKNCSCARGAGFALPFGRALLLPRRGALPGARAASRFRRSSSSARSRSAAVPADSGGPPRDALGGRSSSTVRPPPDGAAGRRRGLRPSPSPPAPLPAFDDDEEAAGLRALPDDTDDADASRSAGPSLAPPPMAALPPPPRPLVPSANHSALDAPRRGAKFVPDEEPDARRTFAHSSQ
jgi:hypothetical protein